MVLMKMNHTYGNVPDLDLIIPATMAYHKMSVQHFDFTWEHVEFPIHQARYYMKPWKNKTR